MSRFMGIKSWAAPALLCLSSLLLSSCNSAFLNPFRGADPLEFTRANSAMTLVNHRVRPATTLIGKRSLTLEDCRALALSNNLELQATRLEELSRRAIHYSNRTRILPHFLFTGDLSDRSALRFSYSDVLGQEGLPPRLGGAANTGVTSFSTGHERTTWYYALETRWSPTDAALAYYVTRSSMNDRMKAHFHKARVAQKLVELIDSTYFRLIGLQDCLPLAERLLALRNDIRYKTGQLLAKKLARIEDYHRAEEKALRADQMLSKLRLEIENRRNMLASAMSLSPDYRVDGGFILAGALTKPQYAADMSEMEMIGVQRRPEAYDAGLKHFNSINDVKRTVVKYFPKVTGFWRYARDKDKFLYDKDWREVGVSIYFDLVEWLANVDESTAARVTSDQTEREMGAIALSIAGQVRNAALKYFGAMDELRGTQMSVASFSRVLQAAEARHSMEDLEKLAVDEAKGDLMDAKIANIRTLAEANAQLAELQSAMGTNYDERMSHD